MGELKVAELISFAVFTAPAQVSCGTVTAKKPFSQHGRVVTVRGEGCVERNGGRGNVSDRLKIRKEV